MATLSSEVLPSPPPLSGEKFSAKLPKELLMAIVRKLGVESLPPEKQKLDSFQVTRIYYKYLKVKSNSALSKEYRDAILLELQTIGLFPGFFDLISTLHQYLLNSPHEIRKYLGLIDMMIEACRRGIIQENMVPQQDSPSRLELYGQRYKFLLKLKSSFSPYSKQS